MNILVSPNPTNAATQGHPQIRIVIVGHVDHGKSTLIGRLLHETGSLPDGKLQSLKAMSTRRGMPFEWSFLLDALQTERDQGITIDTSQIRFRTGSREVVLIDAPGHTEFLRNMITGASQADAAILIIDAAEGVREQTRRHGYLLHLLGIRQVAVVVNKMDRVDFSQARFSKIAKEIGAYLTGLGVTPVATVPISARHGDGIAALTPAINWYHGPTVLAAFDRFLPATAPQDLALRLPVQAVYKFDDRRIIVGRIESGRISVGDEVLIMPGAKLARVKSIESWPVPHEGDAPQTVPAGRSVGITLDHELFIERGNLLTLSSAPSDVSNVIRARVFWLAQTALAVGTAIVVRSATAEARGLITAIDKAIDPGALQSTTANEIPQNYVGEVEINLAAPLAADSYTVNPFTGRFALDLDGRIAGGGLILALDDDTAATASATTAPRAEVPTKHGITTETPRVDLAAKAARLGLLLKPLSPIDRLHKLREEIAGRIVFTTSFGLEDQVILHMLVESGVEVDLVTLDTGRLFAETYDLWAETEDRFGRRIRAVYPHQDKVAALVDRQGINGFYKTRDARLACCHVRKVEPLNRALIGAEAWIAGLRAEQSAGRRDMALVGVDTGYQLIKLNPLFDWTREAVQRFATAENLPVNPLHAKGFASIGCAPCTREIAPGEHERAGRWWWEDETKKECGLHTANNFRSMSA